MNSAASSEEPQRKRARRGRKCEGPNCPQACATKRCGKCHDAAYCSRKCQSADWQQHQTTCAARRAQRERRKASLKGSSGTGTTPASGSTSSTLAFQTGSQGPHQDTTQTASATPSAGVGDSLLRQVVAPPLRMPPGSSGGLGGASVRGGLGGWRCPSCTYAGNEPTRMFCQACNCVNPFIAAGSTIVPFGRNINAAPIQDAHTDDVDSDGSQSDTSWVCNACARAHNAGENCTSCQTPREISDALAQAGASAATGSMTEAPSTTQPPAPDSRSNAK
eukprot:INCI83.1.p1 GENE.INCI83.1~~INCI83.1.p1  ORF type:complete len:277 (+),score=24.17 INCI83.1:87-917(+)